MKKSNISPSYHRDIFYPNNKEEIEFLLDQNSVKSQITNPSALLLPHASYSFIAPLLQEGLINLDKSYETILIISPSHQEILEKDKPFNIFTTSYESIETPYGELEFNQELIKDFASEKMIRNSYFEEEPAFELLYPIIKKYLPSSKVVPMCVSINSSKQSKDLSSILNKIYTNHPNILIIVSGNLNAYKKADFAYKEACNFKELVESGEYLTQHKAKREISSCCCGIIDSLKKTKILKEKNWELIRFESEGKISSEIEEIITKSKIVYHALGILK